MGVHSMLEELNALFGVPSLRGWGGCIAPHGVKRDTQRELAMGRFAACHAAQAY
jgi:hypothetical protein